MAQAKSLIDAMNDCMVEDKNRNIASFLLENKAPPPNGTRYKVITHNSTYIGELHYNGRNQLVLVRDKGDIKDPKKDKETHYMVAVNGRDNGVYEWVAYWDIKYLQPIDYKETPKDELHITRMEVLKILSDKFKVDINKIEIIEE